MTDTLTLILNFDELFFRWGIYERFEVRCWRFICEGRCHKMTTVQPVIVTDIWHDKYFCRSYTSVFSSHVVILLAYFVYITSINVQLRKHFHTECLADIECIECLRIYALTSVLLSIQGLSVSYK